jgi:hypothetical protein
MFQRLFGSKADATPPFHPDTPGLGLSTILSFPFATIRIVGELVCNSVTPFMWKISQGKKSPVYNYKIGSSINVQDIIRIKRKYGVTFSSVVFSMLGGGMHRFIKKRMDEADKEMNPIGTMPSMIPVPITGHGDTFENHL